MLIKSIFGLVEMTFGLVHANYSMPKCEAVKLTLFVPCLYTFCGGIHTQNHYHLGPNFRYLRLFHNWQTTRLRLGWPLAKPCKIKESMRVI